MSSTNGRWFKVILIILLGGLLFLGLIFTLIFGLGVKEPQPNDNFSMEPFLTSDDPSNVIYKDVEPQAVAVTVEFETFGDFLSDACEARITLESKNGDIFEDIKFVPGGVKQDVTLVGKKVTKVTVEATNVAVGDLCILDIFGATNIDF